MNNWYNKIAQRDYDKTKSLSYLEIGHNKFGKNCLWLINDKFEFFEKISDQYIEHADFDEFRNQNILASGIYDYNNDLCSMALKLDDVPLTRHEKIKNQIATMLYKRYNCKDIIYYD